MGENLSKAPKLMIVKLGGWSGRNGDECLAVYAVCAACSFLWFTLVIQKKLTNFIENIGIYIPYMP
jgi:hypothetical protein